MMKRTMAYGLVMGLVLAMATLSLSGCGPTIPVAVTIHSDLRVPAVDELPDDADIPEDFQRYFGNWNEIEANLEMLSDSDFLYTQERTICGENILDNVRDEVYRIITRRIIGTKRLRSAVVQSIRLEASEGDFSWVDNVSDTIYVGGEEYQFTLGASGPTVLLMQYDRPFLGPQADVARIFEDDQFTSCVKNIARISGTLPQEECVFDVVVNVQINTYLFPRPFIARASKILGL